MLLWQQRHLQLKLFGRAVFQKELKNEEFSSNVVSDGLAGFCINMFGHLTTVSVPYISAVLLAQSWKWIIKRMTCRHRDILYAPPH